MKATCKSILNNANAAFRSREYEKAVTLYNQALDDADIEFKENIRFNRDLALKKLKENISISGIDSLSFEKPVIPVINAFLANASPP